MNINKDINEIKIAVLVSCYERIEYTSQCLKALEEAQDYNKNIIFYLVDDGSKQDNYKLLLNSSLNKIIIKNKHNFGLRSVILGFFEWSRKNNIDIIAHIGNDVMMPKNWLDDMLAALVETDLDVASCNYMPSNPAFTQGSKVDGSDRYRLAHNIVGLWFMDRRLTDDIILEKAHLYGISGSTAILNQIKVEKDPRIGWVTSVMALDKGHWSGLAEGHIKSIEHREYYDEVGRGLSW